MVKLTKLLLIAAGTAVLAASSCAPAVTALDDKVLVQWEEIQGVDKAVRILMGDGLYCKGLNSKDTFNTLMRRLNDYCEINHYTHPIDEDKLGDLNTPEKRFAFIAGLVEEARQPLADEQGYRLDYPGLETFFRRVRSVNRELKDEDIARFDDFTAWNGLNEDINRFRNTVGRMICLFGPPRMIRELRGYNRLAVDFYLFPPSMGDYFRSNLDRFRERQEEMYRDAVLLDYGNKDNTPGLVILCGRSVLYIEKEHYARFITRA